jgi:hypothetical protein
MLYPTPTDPGSECRGLRAEPIGRLQGRLEVEGPWLPFRSQSDYNPIAPDCKEVLMFDSLEQQMKHNEDRISTSKERMLRYGLYALAGALVIAGLIYAVHLIG